MRNRISILLIITLLALAIVSPVAAQENLIVNATRTGGYLWGGESAIYSSSLTEGHWNVIVSSNSFWGLEVRITVANDASFTSIIAESGTGTGNFPEVSFDLDTAQAVYILVEENSVYNDSGGFYDIGVYDDATAFGTRIISFFWKNIIVLSFAIPLLFICCCIAFARRGRGPTAQRIQRRRSFIMDAPSFAIPDDYGGRSRSDGSEITTVRVPSVCPNCKGSLTQDNLDWTGPLEAKCNYCGAAIRATFERI